MPRPKFTTAERKRVLERADNPHGAGGCWHCGVTLIGSWDVDHHPCAYRDIENQICCGVRDPKEFSNLVPSCQSCNRSHQFESSAWCGYSQCPCTVKCVCMLTSFLAALVVTGVLVGVRLLS